MCISDVEQFLNENTFYCQPYKARISHQACKLQSARAFLKKQEAQHVLRQAESRSWNKNGNSTLKLQALLHSLPFACLRCKKYEEPSGELRKQVQLRGKSRQRSMFGRFSHAKGSLSRTSPITETLSQLYYQTT